MTDAARQARHELRTPVNHILSYARLVLEEAEELGLDEEIEAHLDTIQAAGHQALILIDALLERSGPMERQALRALAERIAEQAARVREMTASAGHAQAAEDVGRIAEAAIRLVALVSDAPPQQPAPSTDRPDPPPSPQPTVPSGPNPNPPPSRSPLPLAGTSAQPMFAPRSGGAGGGGLSRHPPRRRRQRGEP